MSIVRRPAARAAIALTAIAFAFSGALALRNAAAHEDAGGARASTIDLATDVPEISAVRMQGALPELAPRRSTRTTRRTGRRRQARQDRSHHEQPARVRFGPRPSAGGNSGGGGTRSPRSARRRSGGGASPDGGSSPSAPAPASTPAAPAVPAPPIEEDPADVDPGVDDPPAEDASDVVE